MISTLHTSNNNTCMRHSLYSSPGEAIVSQTVSLPCPRSPMRTRASCQVQRLEAASCITIPFPLPQTRASRRGGSLPLLSSSPEFQGPPRCGKSCLLSYLCCASRPFFSPSRGCGEGQPGQPFSCLTEWDHCLHVNRGSQLPPPAPLVFLSSLALLVSHTHPMNPNSTLCPQEKQPGLW